MLFILIHAASSAFNEADECKSSFDFVFKK